MINKKKIVFSTPMASIKYRFNPETISYEKIMYPFRKKLISLLSYFFSILIFSGVFLHILDSRIDSPRARKLISQKQEIEIKLHLMENEVTRIDEIISEIQYNDDHIYRTYFEVAPIPASLRDAGFGGTTGLDIFQDSRFYYQLTRINHELDKISKKLVVQSKSFDEVLEMASTKEKRLAARPAIQPVSIKELTHFGSSFGVRMHPILKVRKMHEGIDLTAPRGTNIFATADGVVLQAEKTNSGYGNKIIIDHGFGYRTLYGHCYKMFVTAGQTVKRGDVIGTVGSTGLSVSPHLHYEVHVNGRPVNPIYYYANNLSAEEYDYMISMLSSADPGFDIN